MIGFWATTQPGVEVPPPPSWGVGTLSMSLMVKESIGEGEVFEVYPGIGKRNGSSLLSLVGDVTKNHIVKRGNKAASRDLPTQEKRQFNFFQLKSNTAADSSLHGELLASLWRLGH